MSDDLEFIVIDDIPEYIFCIGDDEENERVIALSGKDGAFKYEKVAELPTTGEDGVLYLVPKSHTTQTASGNPISVNIADDAGKIESLKLDGDTYQQSYTGKNLFNVATAIDGHWLNYQTGKLINDSNPNVVSNFIEVTSGTTYTISGADDLHIDVWQYAAQDENTATARIVLSANQPHTFTPNAPWIRFAVGSGDAISVKNQFMLEVGSTTTSFEPYTGGQESPNPDYPQQIQTVTGEQTVTIGSTAYPINLGKNLFDKSVGFENKYYDNSGTILSDNRIALFNGYIQANPGTIYTFSCNARVNNLGIVFFDPSKNFISRTVAFQASYNTVTTPSNCRFIRLQTRYGDVTMDSNVIDSMDLMLEVGSQATTYAPYFTPIELCKLGDYQDYIYKDGNDWKVHKATGLWPITDNSAAKGYTWEGSRKRIYLNPNAGDGLIFSAKVAAMADNDTVFTAYASKFVAKSFNNVITDGINGFCLSQSKAMSFRNNAWANETTARGQLDGTKVIYPLATPTDTIITDQTLIAQLEAIRTASLENGTNTITNTAAGTNLAGDLEIGYYGYDPLNKYDKYFWLDVDGAYESL